MKAKGFRTRSARDVFRKDAEELAAAVGEGEAQGLYPPFIAGLPIAPRSHATPAG